MNDINHGKLELLICLHFPTAATGIKQGGRVTLMSLATLSSGLAVLLCGRAVLGLTNKQTNKRKTKEKQRELIKYIECSDALVQCK